MNVFFIHVPDACNQLTGDMLPELEILHAPEQSQGGVDYELTLTGAVTSLLLTVPA